MHLLVSLYLSVAALTLTAAGREESSPPALRLNFTVQGGGEQGWPRVLSSIGLLPSNSGEIHVAYSGEEAEWRERVSRGTILILTGASPLAQAFGFRPTDKRVEVRSLADAHNSELGIVWKESEYLQRFEVPASAKVFTRERWTGAPLAAGFRHGAGAVFWTAAGIGEKGHERFPYLAQALASLGLDPPFRSRRLWAFFDASYRSRVDLDYFAERWRQAGIAALHVAAWHFWEPDAERDKYLNDLIAACHRRAITVYAWLEFPHVSQKFWDDHPEWREKTAAGQDAHLDWRKLMNFENAECKREAAAGMHRLISRFDWDGVNLAELYFESLEGAANPARFTPMNGIVRERFAQERGFDPASLFPAADPARLREFLDWRADLAAGMQREWLGELESARAGKPWLDLVLTHVDDRFDTRMRDLIGADAARALPLLDRHDFTFLVEDPATIWHLGPERYPEIARRYEPVNPRPGKLAIDINIVERYQDVYPTKQQTGGELFQLVHLAAEAFPRVALYFESSLLKPDLGLLPAAASTVTRAEQAGGRMLAESRQPAGVAWPGPALVDGKLWPFQDGRTVWLPAGAHTIESAAPSLAPRILDLSGDIESASVGLESIEFGYRSSTRAFAALDREPAAMEIDGAAAELHAEVQGTRWILTLPRGQHLVQLRFRPPSAAKTNPERLVP
jgi:hypothetical protein